MHSVSKDKKLACLATQGGNLRLVDIEKNEEI